VFSEGSESLGFGGTESKRALGTEAISRNRDECTATVEGVGRAGTGRQADGFWWFCPQESDAGEKPEFGAFLSRGQRSPAWVADVVRVPPREMEQVSVGSVDDVFEK